MRKPRLDGQIFWPAVLIITGVAAMLLFFPDDSRRVSAVTLAAITYDFGAVAQWAVLLGTGWLLWLAMSRYGSVKLGGFEDKPEFSTASWISLMVTAGTSMSLMILACIEPISHLASPPLGLTADSLTAMDWSVAFAMFHWGFSGWAFYSIAGVAIAYTYHVRRIPYLKGSVACGGVLGNHVNGWLGKIIDLIIVLGLVGGIGTSQGIIVPVLSSLVAEIFSLPHTRSLEGMVVLAFAALAAYSVYLGLYKGMQKLSQIRAWSSLGLTLFVFLVGPTSFLLAFFGQSLGLMMQNYFAMSTYIAPFQPGAAAADWTVFYWAWWGAYSLYMGIFIARISKGRTIRQMIMGSLIIPSLVCFFVFMAFGGYAVHLHHTGQADLVRLMQDHGMGALLVYILKSLPFAQAVFPLYIVTGIISMATAYQGEAYGVASIATEKLFAGEDPAAWHRIFWVLASGGFGFAVVMVNDMNVVRLASVISLVPMLVILVMMVISFMRWIRLDLSASQETRPLVLGVRNQKKNPEQKTGS